MKMYFFFNYENVIFNYSVGFLIFNISYKVLILLR